MLRERYLTKLKRLGRWAFQDRLEALFDPGTLTLVNVPDWDAAWEQAVVTAHGRVGDRPVVAYASNFLVREGTIGFHEGHAIAAALDLAVSEGAVVVGLLETNGARVDERYEALSGNATLFRGICRASGAVPQLTACLGLCLGVGAYLAALADACVMVPGQTYAATTSPAVVKAATGRATTLDELGGADMHAKASGVAQFLAEDDAGAIALLRELVAFMAPAAAKDPPAVDLARVVPDNPRLAYDVRKLIAGLVDGGAFREWHAGWGGSMVVGLARLDGRAVGVVANQPLVRGGVLDVEAARKAARFAQAMDAWGLPLVYLVDVPGIMVSPDEERKGILDAGALLYQAVDTDVARVAVVTRKCFGGAFVMLQATQAGGDRVLAWPTAQIGIAGAEASFAILHGKDHLTHEAPDAFKAESLELLRTIPDDAYAAQRAGIVDEVVSPARTRAALIAALATPPAPRRRPARRHPVLPF